QVAVMVPGGVVQADAAHAALDQPPGQEAVEGKLAELPPSAAAAGADLGLVTVGAVFVERPPSLAADVDQFGCGRLHAKRQLVRVNASVDRGVAGLALS